MKKKTIANIIMVVVILMIVVTGMLSVAYIKGRFDKVDDNSVLLTDYHGIIMLEREGIAYTTTEDTVLRDGDKIKCTSGSTVKINIGDSYIVLGQNAETKITNATASSFALNINIGEVFVYADSNILLSFDGKNAVIDDSVVTLSVRHGAQSINVYSGTVNEVQSGNMIEWVGETLSVRPCSINSLNDFNITQIRNVNKFKTLVFTNDDLDRLEIERYSEMENEFVSGAVVESEEAPDDIDATDTIDMTDTTESTEIVEYADDTKSVKKPTKKVKAPKKSDNTKPVVTLNPTIIPEISETGKPIETPNIEVTLKPDETNNVVVTKQPQKTSKPLEINKSTATPKSISTLNPTSTPKVSTDKACTITIRCDTILDNWDNLELSKVEFVPENGCILPTAKVEFTEGETVFDVLKRVCSDYDIQIEYSWTPMYESYYIEGINNLYEFDCGYESGWMYKVNGWFPNYGCSSYTLEDGDNIVWCYTCVGLGADVGDMGW